MMVDWSWLEEDEDTEILKSFENIQYIRCYGSHGSRYCHLYTKEGFERLIRKPTYHGEIDRLYITINGGADIGLYYETDTTRKDDAIILHPIEVYTLSAKEKLSCKLTRDKNTNQRILYCEAEEER